MKNTLNPCKCGSSEGAEFASQVEYDGLSIPCLPNAVGKDLAKLLKEMGDLICASGGGLTVLLDNSLVYGMTGAALNAKPALADLKPGDFAYSQTNGVQYTKLIGGSWSVQNIEIV